MAATYARAGEGSPRLLLSGMNHGVPLGARERTSWELNIRLRVANDWVDGAAVPVRARVSSIDRGDVTKGSVKVHAKNPSGLGARGLSTGTTTNSSRSCSSCGAYTLEDAGVVHYCKQHREGVTVDPSSLSRRPCLYPRALDNTETMPPIEGKGLDPDARSES